MTAVPWLTLSLDSMGNLLAFEGYENASTPFSWQEHNFLWKGERRYHDFHPGNAYNASCEYPRMWDQDGYPIREDILSQQVGCRSSEFDQVSSLCYIFSGPTDPPSTVISRGPEPIRRGNRSCQDLHPFKIVYESGGMMSLIRSRSCRASKSPCWTSTAFAWTRHCRQRLTN